MSQQADQPTQYEKPLPELVKDLTREISSLVRDEVALAKAELAEKGKQAGIGAGLFGGAGVFGFLALAALTTCFIVALSEVIHPALAALAVAVVYGIIAAVLGMSGKGRIAEATPPATEEAIESVKEDVQWLKGQKR